MPPTTSICAEKADADEFRVIAESLRIPHRTLFKGLVRNFGRLTREQQERELGLVPATPSAGVNAQSDDSANAKQSHQLPTSRPARRRAG